MFCLSRDSKKGVARDSAWFSDAAIPRSHGFVQVFKALFFIWFGGLLLPVNGFSQQVHERSSERTNVLLIMVDDLNDWIEPLNGNQQASTPHLNRLFQRGVLFANAHCQAPICNPSRASMMTGLRPSTTGIYYLSPQIRQCESTRNAVTLPQFFGQRGFRTMAAGKILHNDHRNEFDHYAGSFGGFGPRPPKPIEAGHTHPLWDWGVYPRGDKGEANMPDVKIADWASQQLARDHEKPFFLAVGFYRPHVPMYAPQRWFDKHALGQIQLPLTTPGDLDDVPRYAQDLSWSAVAPRHRWMTENQQWKKAVQAYLASVSFVDAQVGAVLDALNASQYRDNTVVVLCSDHGFHLGTKERWGKRSLWEDATRVPLLIAGPGIPANRRCEQPVGLIDVYPTLCELFGFLPNEGLEGHSLAPLLEDPKSDREWPALTTFGQHNHSLRSVRFRYTVYADKTEELYDHQSDPSEFTNLLATGKAPSAKIAAEVARLRKFLPDVNVPMAPGSQHADARPGSPADIDNPPGRKKPNRKSRKKPNE